MPEPTRNRTDGAAYYPDPTVSGLTGDVDRFSAREITQVSIVKMGHIYSDDIFLGSYSNLK